MRCPRQRKSLNKGLDLLLILVGGEVNALTGYTPLLIFPSASLRSELNHIHASAIEHLRQTHQQESAAAKVELQKTMENSRMQVGLGFP